MDSINQGQGPWRWTHDSGPTTLTPQLLMKILLLSLCLFGVIFCIYCPHCTPKKKIIVNVYLWLNTLFIQEEYPGKSKAITRNKTDMEQQLKPIASLTKAVLFWGFSSVGVEGRWGDFHFLESCYVVAKDMKHEPKVPWHIIV